MKTTHPRGLSHWHRKVATLKSVWLFLFMATLGAGERPNIIFLFTDDQAYDTLGCYGNPNVKTPNIDRLGRNGLIFDRHYNTTAICMASRANVMTGLLEYRSGCNFSRGPLARELWEKSYPMQLRRAGYKTAFGGKFGFAVTGDPTQGNISENKYENLPVDDFDFWVGGTGQTSYDTAKNRFLARFADKFPHSSRAYGAAGQEFIRQSAQGDSPFCLTLFFKAPHRPTTPDPAFDHIYQDTLFRKLPNYGRKAGEHLAPQSKRGRQYPRFEEWGYHTEESYQKSLRTYHQQIYGVDVAVGMILDELKRQAIDQNTVIIFSSDNGFFNGSHGMGSKVLPYEEGSRVPLIIFDPRQPIANRGRRSSAVTGNIDIAATILSLAQIPLQTKLDGKSLIPIVNQSATQVREALPLIQVWGPSETYCFAIVSDSHKYAYWPWGQTTPPFEELFDLRADPFEMENVIQDPLQEKDLNRMQAYYQIELGKWQKHRVDYGGYPRFDTLFDNQISWEDKRATLK